MTIHDLRDYPPDSKFHADICIVGSGPAGLAIATQFLSTSTRVCVVESGGFDREPDTEALSEFESVGLNRAPYDTKRCRTFGGTSAHWTGRSGVFDAIDFQTRPWIPHSGWPIGMADIEPYLDQAGQLLGLGPAVYSNRIWELLGRGDPHPAWDKDRLQSVIWQYSRHPGASSASVNLAVDENDLNIGNISLQHPGAPQAIHLGTAYRSTLQAADNIMVLLHANVTEIITDDTASIVRGVDLRTIEGKRARVSANRVVLCCGAVDNARLLLLSRSGNPNGLGNNHDVVGRYLMDHPIVSVASYQGKGSEVLRRRLGHHWFDRQGTRYVYHTGLRLSPLEQRSKELLNCSVHLFEHGDGRYAESPVSAAGRLARALKRGKVDQIKPADLRQIVANPAALLKGVYDRNFLHRPPLTLPSRVDVACVVEQVPDPRSRMTLSGERDVLGMNRAKIDWRSADLEFETVRAMTSVFLAELQRQGYELPVAAPWLEEKADSFRSLISDSAHAMGTTRMSCSPKEGVVDSNCAVHGVKGLYIAGGSVMSTSSHMNPTLMIVALSLRLAKHLQVECHKSLDESLHGVPPHIGFGDRKARVGIVGGGDRIKNIYLPILKSLEESFEIVGFTTRTKEKAEAFATEFGIKFFSNARSLVAEQKPNFLIVAVSNDSISAVQKDLLELNIPLLLETPFSWNIRKGKNSLGKIRRNQLTVGVAEQTPFLPIEQMKRQLVELGLIGRIVAVRNDFLSYNYHGIARLRFYLGSEPKPVAVNAIETNFPSGMESAEATKKWPTNEKWMLGTVRFSDGSTLLHNYSSSYFTSSIREPRSIHVYGSHGTMNDDEILFKEKNGEAGRASITRQMSGDRLKALVVRTPLGDVQWLNPYFEYSFNDEQIAVATLLKQMRNAVLFNGFPAYTASEGFQDTEILTAMNFSIRSNGRPVRFPLRLLMEFACTVLRRAKHR